MVDLESKLDLAHKWHTVLLIDEADVFVEQREVRDVAYNALVSIFLRKLEYFLLLQYLVTVSVLLVF